MSLSLPPVQMAAVNGLRMALYEAGPAASAYPPLVLCHGFPELAYSWRSQIAGLAAAGFRVLAPDMRGYGGSSAPERIEAYDLEHLTSDVIGLLDAKGLRQAVLIGHDWGGFVVWATAQRYPERVLGVAALNTRHSKRAPADPIEIFKKRFGESHYIVAFQEPGVAEAVLERHVERTFRLLTQLPPTDAAPSAASFSMLDAVSADAGPPLRPSVLSESELAVYIETFSRTGFRGGINWYRNISRNWANSADVPDLIRAPALIIYTDRDPTCTPASLEGMEEIVPDLEKRLIPNCGHWTMAEQPDAVNEALIGWLKRRFAG
jgi:microsomal epoxide hydrolase/non-specific protein-tyrosine kinase